MFNKICENVYYMPHNHYSDRPAIGLVIGERSALLYDSGNSYKHAKEIVDGVRKITNLPIENIVLSHWHWDHVFGAYYIDTKNLISHPFCAEQLKAISSYKWDDESLDERVLNGLEIDFCREHIRKELAVDERESVKIAIPNLYVSDKMQIDLGGVTVEIFHLGGEHSADSICLYVNDRKVLFLGDGICQELFLGPWSYDLPDIDRRLSDIEKYDCIHYINSHWDPQDSEEFKVFCEDIRTAGQAVGEKRTVLEAFRNFVSIFGREPTIGESYNIKAFVEGNLKKQNL